MLFCQICKHKDTNIIYDNSTDEYVCQHCYNIEIKEEDCYS